MRRSLSVSELTPGEFSARLDQLITVYAAAMRPPTELLPGRKTIMARHAANPGFRALAVTDDGTGEPVGFGYGFHGAIGQWWHDKVRGALTASRGAAAAGGWMDDSFEVAELHVTPTHQGQGIGADVLVRLTATRTRADGAAIHQGRRLAGPAALPGYGLCRPAHRVQLLPER